MRHLVSCLKRSQPLWHETSAGLDEFRDYERNHTAFGQLHLDRLKILPTSLPVDFATLGIFTHTLGHPRLGPNTSGYHYCLQTSY